MKKIKNIFFIFFSSLVIIFIIYSYTLVQVKFPKIEKVDANFTFENNFGMLYSKNFIFNFTSSLIKFNSLKKIELYNISIKNKVLNLNAKKAYIDNKSFIMFDNLISKIKQK